uniref:Uncharacterized protein n=1 Tax=Anopheles funestus TaxID=62324 RepID=A0A4Y0BHM1_ANOFN
MSTVSDQRMKGQGTHGNGDYNSWSAQVNHGPGGAGHQKNRTMATTKSWSLPES